MLHTQVAPFDAAIAVMVLGAAVIALTWPENYGNTSETTSLATQLKAATAAIVAGDGKGATRMSLSCIDACMY